MIKTSSHWLYNLILPNYSFYVKMRGKYFHVFRDKISPLERLLFKNYAIFTNLSDWESLKNIKNALYETDMDVHGKVWSENYKKLPLSLVKFIKDNYMK